MCFAEEGFPLQFEKAVVDKNNSKVFFSSPDLLLRDSLTLIERGAMPICINSFFLQHPFFHEKDSSHCRQLYVSKVFASKLMPSLGTILSFRR